MHFSSFFLFDRYSRPRCYSSRMGNIYTSSPTRLYKVDLLGELGFLSFEGYFYFVKKFIALFSNKRIENVVEILQNEIVFLYFIYFSKAFLWLENSIKLQKHVLFIHATFKLRNVSFDKVHLTVCKMPNLNLELFIVTKGEVG